MQLVNIVVGDRHVDDIGIGVAEGNGLQCLDNSPVGLMTPVGIVFFQLAGLYVLTDESECGGGVFIMPGKCRGSLDDSQLVGNVIV